MMETLGSISEMVVGLPRLAASVQVLEKELEGLLHALSPAARGLVFFASQAGMPREIKIVGRSVTLIPLPDEIAKHWAALRWVQDYVAIGKDGSLLLQLQAKPHEIQLVQILAQVLGRRWEKVPFQFDGGNLRLVGDTLLVGKNCLVRNGVLGVGGRSDYAKWKEVEHGFRRLWGVERVLWLGNDKQSVSRPSFLQEGDWTFQPFYHLDLYLMPLGKGRIAVGNLDSRFLKGDRRPIYLQLDEIERQLDFLVKELVEGGYQVIRLPLFMGLGSCGTRLYSHLNGLVEEDSMGRVRCLLPSYVDGPPVFRTLIQRLETTIRQKLSSLSIQVNFIEGGFGKTAERMGALHCTTNIISRIHG